MARKYLLIYSLNIIKLSIACWTNFSDSESKIGELESEIHVPKKIGFEFSQSIDDAIEVNQEFSGAYQETPDQFVLRLLN